MLDLIASMVVAIGDAGKSENSALSFKLVLDEMECPESLIE